MWTFYHSFYIYQLKIKTIFSSKQLVTCESFPLFSRVQSNELVFQQSPEVDMNYLKVCQCIADTLLCSHCLVFGQRESFQTRLLTLTQSRVSDSFLLSGTIECSQVLNVLSCYVASTISPWSIGCFEWEMAETITQAPGVSSPSRSRFPGLFSRLRQETLLFRRENVSLVHIDTFTLKITVFTEIT